MKIGMYSIDEIYDELANGFLHHSMVDAMYFEIKKLRKENQQLENNRDKAIERIQYEEMFDYDNNHLINFKEELKYILLKGDNK